MNPVGMLSGAINALAANGRKILMWGGGLLGVEYFTRGQAGQGGTVTQGGRAVGDAAITETSAVQARNMLWDMTAGASARVNAFLGGTLKVICDFLAHMGFEPARRWSESLSNFRDGQEREIQALRERSRANAGGTRNENGIIASAVGNVAEAAAANPVEAAALGLGAAGYGAYRRFSGGGTPPSGPTGGSSGSTPTGGTPTGGAPTGGAPSPAAAAVTPARPASADSADDAARAARRAAAEAEFARVTTPPAATAGVVDDAARAAARTAAPSASGSFARAARGNAAVAGVVAGVTFFSSMFTGSSRAEAATAAAETVPFVAAGREAAAGNNGTAARMAASDAATLGGGLAGAWAGAAAGATVGSVVPLVGTAVGGVVGGLAGGIGGALGAGEVVDRGLNYFFGPAAARRADAPTVATPAAPVPATPRVEREGNEPRGLLAGRGNRNGAQRIIEGWDDEPPVAQVGRGAPAPALN